MEIFKLFESTMANVQPGHPSTKDLRRDQILNNYVEATKTLNALIKAKESEISYRRDLIEMLEKSKAIYDNKLIQAKQTYQTAKKNAPESLGADSKKVPGLDTPTISTTPPLPPSLNLQSETLAPTNTIPVTGTGTQSSQRSDDSFDIPLPHETIENRSSLDRRLSEFLKTFPNLTQAGLSPSQNNNVRPLPGYYTQQLPPPPPMAAAPPLMAMMRFPPPPLMQPAVPPNMNPGSQENHDAADMDLSDFDEPSNNGAGASAGPIIPMVASAMQQGAGGKHHLRAEPQQSSYVAGQHFNNPVQYAPRLNPLPFDPSIMEPGLRDSSSSSGSREKTSHGDRSGSHRHSSGSGGSNSSTKQGSDKNRYSSSHSSSRNKRR